MPTLPRPSTTHPRPATLATRLAPKDSPEALWTNVLELWTTVCNDRNLPAETRDRLARSLHEALMAIAESGTRARTLEEARRAVVEAKAALESTGPQLVVNRAV
jgi:hypothetical protein